MEIDRRELFRIITAGVTLSPVVAQEHHHERPPVVGLNIASYQPRALSPGQYKTLDAMSEILIPTGEDGPGAHEAGVAYYLDTVLHYGDESRRGFWRRGLDAAAAGSSLEAVIDQWAKNEAAPQNSHEEFFVAFKYAVIDAFFLSQAGRKSAGYTGDTALVSFHGCTHPEHQSS